MGASACKCVHLASSNLPCGPVSLQAKPHGGVSLHRSNTAVYSLMSSYYLPFLLIHTHKVSLQFEKVSRTTLDLKVKMQSVTVLCGDCWSWVGVHFITQPCKHNNRNL